MVYFVGMHNKPNSTPLCSKTHTGKIVDAIIKEIGEGVKTNLADVDFLPLNPEWFANYWHHRHELKEGDIVVLFGKWVQKHFKRHDLSYHIAVDHPSAFRVRSSVPAYVQRLVSEINKIKNIELDDTPK